MVLGARATQTGIQRVTNRPGRPAAKVCQADNEQVRMHFALDMEDLTSEQEELGEDLGAAMGNAHTGWDVTWTPGFTRRGDQFRGSFHIVGTVEADGTREKLAQAVVDAVGPAIEQVGKDWARQRKPMPELPFEVKVWFPAG